MLESANEQIVRVVRDLDPVKEPGFVFDPSDPRLTSRIVGIALLAQPRQALGSIGPFYGSGVYALYYAGSFPAYRAVSGKEHPIYVGKAGPASPNALTARSQGTRLYIRLNEHRKSIRTVAATLAESDFEYRALPVQSGWEGAAEEYLIRLFRPIWNQETKIAFGIGKHGDSSSTRANLRSPWDTLHVGRSWAHGDTRIGDAKPPSQIAAEIEAHFVQNPPFASIEDVIRQFLDDMRPSP